MNKFPTNLINQIYCTDNLELMHRLPDSFIDLIYCDVLYGTGRDFGYYQDLPCDRQVIEAHYVPRIEQMYRILKDTGSIYLQMDTRINHWVRCIMDDVFKHFRNEIVWCYNTQGYSKNKYSRKHDIILFYTKSDKYVFNAECIRELEPSKSSLERFGDEIKRNGYYIDYKSKKKVFELKGSLPLDWFKMSVLPSAHKEFNGYPTQKPEELIERIIKASSNKGDLVADFYCGSGTTLKVAKQLSRDYIGCDLSEEAIEISRQRVEHVYLQLF